MEATTLATQSIRLIKEYIILFSSSPQTRSILQLRHEISNLQNEFESLQGFLKDGEKRQEEDKDVRKWISSVKDLADEAEDITQKHLKPIKRHRRTQGGRNSCNPWQALLSLIDAMTLDREASRIYSLSNKISRLTSKMKAYGIEFTPLVDPPPATITTAYAAVDLAAEENEIALIGLDDDVKEIENQLICTGSAKIIGICGTNGLGKTSIVKEVLRKSPLVQEHFDAIFWVYLGSEFQAREVLKKVFLDLLDKFGHGDLTDNERNAFADLERDDFVCELVNQILMEKKCLLIFDDLARTDDTFRSALSLISHSPTHSKVIITTCDASVLNSVHHQAYLHQPKCLTSEQKWLLFQGETSFLGQGIRGKAVKSIGERILRGRLLGVPFSIRVLSGILAYDIRHILHHVYTLSLDALLPVILLFIMMYTLPFPIVMFSFSFACSCRKSGDNRPTLESSLFGSQNDEIGVDKVLELSYKALPRRRFRLCLKEMSNHWPEGDGRISTEELFKVWIDKQIVKGRRRSTKEQVAEGYLDELVKRNLVQVIEKDRITGKTTSCQLHSLVRDFYLRINDDVL